MAAREVLRVHPGAVCLLPNYSRDELIWPEDLVHNATSAMSFGVVNVKPDGSVLGKEIPDLQETISDHGEPDRVFQRIVVLKEALLGVERRVDVDELDLAQVLTSELGESSECGQGVEGIAPNEQVVRRARLAALSNARDVVQ